MGKNVFIGYHATDLNYCEDIIKNGFKNQSSESFPNDLGFGVYFYIKMDDTDDPLENSVKYIKKVKKSYKYYIVLETQIEAENILDLNEPDNNHYFTNFMKNNISMIEERARLFPISGITKRGNCDGIALEMILGHLGLTPEAIICDTFTKFNDTYKRSNFPNGRELCLRKTDCIKNIKAVSGWLNSEK